MFINYISEGLRKEYGQKGITVQVGMATTTPFMFYFLYYHYSECLTDSSSNIQDMSSYFHPLSNFNDICEGCRGNYWHTALHHGLLPSRSIGMFIFVATQKVNNLLKEISLLWCSLLFDACFFFFILMSSVTWCSAFLNVFLTTSLTSW